jgi:hypothetical protein
MGVLRTGPAGMVHSPELGIWIKWHHTGILDSLGPWVVAESLLFIWYLSLCCRF